MLISHLSSVELQNKDAEQFSKNAFLSYQTVWFFGNLNDCISTQ